MAYEMPLGGGIHRISSVSSSSSAIDSDDIARPAASAERCAEPRIDRAVPDQRQCRFDAGEGHDAGMRGQVRRHDLVALVDITPARKPSLTLIRTLYDPTCGTGGFLSDGMEHVKAITKLIHINAAVLPGE
ncbi:SAM-dependent DNA methyltransferase [Rhodovulum steppense]|nr:SAM-dependent DNA methyltransferase [Rhodovulum steppense]